MRQTKLALHSATVGDTTYRGWGIAGPMSNIQHNHDNRTIVAGNQFNVGSSSSGNVSVGNVTTNEQAGGKRERYISNKAGSPSRRRHRNENNTNYSANYLNKPRSRQQIEAEEALAAAQRRVDEIRERTVYLVH